MGDRGLADYVDLTLLTPGALAGDIDQLCDDADRWGCFGVCVHPWWVNRASRRVRGTDVAVVTVVGFPLGMNATEIKCLEAALAVGEGADEIDIVINPALVRSEQWEQAQIELTRVIRAAEDAGTTRVITKVIIEAGSLSGQQQVRAGRAAVAAGADFVKTSTGFAAVGAREQDVRRLCLALGCEVGIKAAGGINTAEQARRLIEAGATRLGLSAGKQVLGGQ